MILDALERAYRDSPVRVVILSLVAAVALRLLFTPFGAPLNLDAYAYLLKAAELTRGETTPIHTHAIGWSVALAPVVWLAQSRSMLAQMNVARIVACAVSAIGVVPFFVILKATVDDRAGAIALVLFPFFLQLIAVAVRGMSEPLHMLLLLTALAGALRARQQPVATMVAGVASGLACWVHPTGLLVPILAVTVLVTAERADRRDLTAAVAIAAIALVVAAPALVQRARAFGGPLDFGDNNRILGESGAEMWSPDVPIPTVRDYLATHSIGAMLRRITIDGLGAELDDFAQRSLTLPVVPFAVCGIWLAWRSPRARPLAAALLLFLAAWVIPYPVLGAPRHLATILPLAIACLAICLAGLSKVRSGSLIAVALIVALAIGHSTAATVQRYRLRHDEAMAGVEWGAWTAANVRGRIAIREGQELIMMHLPDAVIGGLDINTMAAPRSGLALVKPGRFDSLDDAMEWMHRNGVTHLVLDYVEDPPKYLEPLRAHPDQPYLTELFSTVGRSAWPVRVVAIRWDRYKPAA